MSNKKTGSRYLRFLFLRLKADEQKVLPDPLSQELLDRIAVADFTDQPLRVTTLMALDRLASPATIHRKMSGLIDEEWVQLDRDPDNGRFRYLRLTSKAMLLYREREKLILSAIME